MDNFNQINEDFRRGIKDDLRSGISEMVKRGREKGEFDRILYKTLVTSVDEIRNSNSRITSDVVFCIIIPQDRVDQISLVDRDFSKRNFSWDYLLKNHLRIMVIKRP